ncbi:MAG TPA: DUF2142 domain-containing protein [Actinomycetota bacterium]|nr:DUF2142 domain-containing protein [Actinomycetota bacterium]
MKPPLLLASAYLLLLVAWAMSHPPGAAPDEYGHYLRAVAAGRGEFLPEQRPGPPTDLERSQVALNWQRSQTRLISIQGRFSPDNFDCIRANPNPSWRCTDPPPPPDETVAVKSVQGTYPPYPYVIPGLFTRLGHDAVSALLWGRVVASLTAWALLALASWMLWDPNRSWISLLGLIVAVTPMVIFVGSSLSGSGLETAAGIAFFACLVRLTRPGTTASRIVWIATGLSGAVLVISRDLGIAWLLLSLSVALGLSCLKRLRAVMASGGRVAWVAIGVIGVAVVEAAIWQAAVQVHPPLSLSRVAANVPAAFGITREILRQQVGVFGWLDTVMPSEAYWIWGAMFLALLALAFLAGSWRQRAVLAASTLGAVMLPVGVELVQREVGFGAQGRHVLPMTVVVPLLAGEILTRNAHRLGWLRQLFPAVWFTAAAGVVYVVAWYINGKRHMVGPGGPDWFWEATTSSPPLGWVTWGLVSIAGAIMISGSGLRAALFHGYER